MKIPPRLFLLFVFALPGLQSLAGAQPVANARAGCTPNGNIFNVESPQNANLLSQFDESVALLVNDSSNGDDLIVGTAEDRRPLVDQSFPFNDAFYVGRNSSDCGAAVDGGMPLISFNGQLFEAASVTGPVVAADPAHHAFFFGDLYLAESPDVSEIAILKTTTSDLLNTTNCPNGTLQNSVPCFEPFAGGVDFSPLNTNPSNPSLAVDQRKTGTGSGDVYVAANLQTAGQNLQLTIAACTNDKLTCGQATAINDFGQFDDARPTIQVRTDGLITISYQRMLSSGSGFQYKFVTCTPNGAPEPPACGNPVVAAQPKNPAIGQGGETAIFINSRPVHVNRQEAGGKTFTTFLIYADCEVPAIQTPLVTFCPKTNVELTHSTDGKTWSTPEKVSAAQGQQFESAMALDESTGTVNIAYYSTENDVQKLTSQVFLAQILPGSTMVSTPHQLTKQLYDAQFFGSFFSGYGDHIAVAAGGTGNPGESKAYVHFTGTPVDGLYNGRRFPIDTNTLTRFDY